MDIIEQSQSIIGLTGWRKIKCWYKKFKKVYRHTSNIHRKKGNNYTPRLQRAASEYIEVSMVLNERVMHSLLELKNSFDILSVGYEQQLRYYQKMLSKHIDLVERRIMRGEKIPHCDKIFSIFEPHVEWLQKGKPNNRVELGHNVLITSDQYQFIVDHKVMIGQTDKAQPIELMDRLTQRFSDGYQIECISFDRGFYSKLSKKNLEQRTENLIMPSKGKKSQTQKEEENEKSYVIFRNKHSAVESNINELEHAGVNKVPDKGLDKFHNYVAWGILSYNIRRLGKIVIEKNLMKDVTQAKKLKRVA